MAPSTWYKSLRNLNPFSRLLKGGQVGNSYEEPIVSRTSRSMNSDMNSYKVNNEVKPPKHLSRPDCLPKGQRKKSRKEILSITRARPPNSDDYSYLPSHMSEVEEVPPRWTQTPRRHTQTQPPDRSIVIRYYYNEDKNAVSEIRDGNRSTKHVRFHEFQSLSDFQPPDSREDRLSQYPTQADDEEVGEDSNEDDLHKGLESSSASEESLRERILNDYQNSCQMRIFRRQKKVEKWSSVQMNAEAEDDNTSSGSSDDGGDLRLPLPKGLKSLKSYGGDDEKLAGIEIRSQLNGMDGFRIPTLSSKLLRGEKGILKDLGPGFFARKMNRWKRNQWPN